MTRFEQLAWFNLVLANIHSAAGNFAGLVGFLVCALICLVIAFWRKA